MSIFEHEQLLSEIREMRSIVLRRLDRIEDRLKTLQEQETIDMAIIDDDIAALTAKVSAESTVVSSAVTLLNGISATVASAVAAALAAGATPDQLKALTDATASIDAQSAQLAAAVAANTPTAPTPAPAA